MIEYCIESSCNLLIYIKNPNLYTSKQLKTTTNLNYRGKGKETRNIKRFNLDHQKPTMRTIHDDQNKVLKEIVKE